MPLSGLDFFLDFAADPINGQPNYFAINGTGWGEPGSAVRRHRLFSRAVSSPSSCPSPLRHRYSAVGAINKAMDTVKIDRESSLQMIAQNKIPHPLCSNSWSLHTGEDPLNRHREAYRSHMRTFNAPCAHRIGGLRILIKPRSARHSYEDELDVHFTSPQPCSNQLATRVDYAPSTHAVPPDHCAHPMSLH